MLAVDPKQRYTPEAALRHPFMHMSHDVDMSQAESRKRPSLPTPISETRQPTCTVTQVGRDGCTRVKTFSYAPLSNDGGRLMCQVPDIDWSARGPGQKNFFFLRPCCVHVDLVPLPGGVKRQLASTVTMQAPPKVARRQLQAGLGLAARGFDK